ncbi:hypothetical protein JQM68_02675 [Oscillibacter valericigenes]|nr:hypothetical protein [Oscillibacter valericigenes]MCF2616097.1 hypothetical protein [Oscillibacter valericigenes]
MSIAPLDVGIRQPLFDICRQRIRLLGLAGRVAYFDLHSVASPIYGNQDYCEGISRNRCTRSASASHTIQNPSQTFRYAMMETWLHGLSDTSKRAIHINLSAECRIFRLSAELQEVSLCGYAPVSFVD